MISDTRNFSALGTDTFSSRRPGGGRLVLLRRAPMSSGRGFSMRRRRATFIRDLDRIRAREGFPSDSTEARFLSAMREAPLGTMAEWEGLFARWSGDGGLAEMQALVVAMLPDQVRASLAMENMWPDFLDILHDAVADILVEMSRENVEDAKSLRRKFRFSILRGRQFRVLRMRRAVRAPIALYSRTTVSRHLDLPLDYLVPEPYHPRKRGIVYGPEDEARAMEEIRRFLSLTDSDDLPSPAVAPHDDDVLLRVDAPVVLRAMETVLDARSLLIVRRHWIGEEDLSALAAELGMTDARARQISRESIKVMQSIFAPEALSEAEERRVRSRRRINLRCILARRSVAGVDLLRAHPFLETVLAPVPAHVIRRRYFSGDLVRPVEDLSRETGLSASRILRRQAEALDILRIRFPFPPE